MPRYKLIVEYDGTHYAGWQRQENQSTVQAALEAAIFKFCGVNAKVAGAGRTDAGVHAVAQAVHVDLPKALDEYNVMQGINFYLFSVPKNGIVVISAKQVPDEFEARFSAKKRHYLYRIINRPARLALEEHRAWHVSEELDADAMHTAGGYLMGDHDFTSFRDAQCQAKSPLKTLDQLEVHRKGDEIEIIASARSFLHHQVRIMVGTLSLVGKRKWKPEDVKKALEACDRAKAGPTAPPEGLYLMKVDY